MTAAAGVRQVTEHLSAGAVPIWVHPDWAVRFPWLVQGTTGRGSDAVPYDLGLSGGQPVGGVLSRWRSLLDFAGCEGIVCSRQVHGADVRSHAGAVAGIQILEGLDGHCTDATGLVVAVVVADCVPVFLVDPTRRCVALLHAGWRGVAVGILEAGVQRVAAEYGSTASELWVHFGPAICGSCYEVGAEVLEALGVEGLRGGGASHVDLREVLIARAAECGIPPTQTSRSTYCTRCSTTGAGDARPFFSHRAGESARQVGILGMCRD